MRRPVIILFMLLVFAASCSDGGSADHSGKSPDGTGASGNSQTKNTSMRTAGQEKALEATTGVASTTKSTDSSMSARVSAAGSTEGPFVASPEMSGGSGSAADTLLAVRYGTHEDYERVVLDLGTGSDAASALPAWSLMSPTGDGLLRVKLTSVSATRVSDGKFDDVLLKNFHVVRGPDGGMFVDIFASKAFTYRVIELENPARLAVDFKTSDMPLGMPLPVEGGKTILTEPRSGARLSTPVTVSGYSRNFEAANTITLTDSKGKEIAHKTVQSNDWSATWGYFEATLDLPSFSGKGTLRVGTQSARDGTFEGVEIPVRGS